MKYTHIIWDWNGTLLDDAGWCVQVINTMLARRGLPVLRDLDAYRRVFGFPVIEYYRRIGFDFEREPFEQLAAEYMELYHGGGGLRLFPDAENVLASIQGAKLCQVILSASKREHLLAQLRPFDIMRYFDEILGVSDIYAHGKSGAGREYIRRAGTCRAVLIGDTTHDHEVAAELGADCILVARGHQSVEALRACGVPVAGTLEEALLFL